MVQRFYLAIIERGSDGFGAFFPDLPGCTTWGATVAEASANAIVAAQAHAFVGVEHGETLPEATPADRIGAQKGVREVARLLVPIDIADERVRVNISLPKSVLAALDAQANARGVDRSAMIGELVIEAAPGALREDAAKWGGSKRGTGKQSATKQARRRSGR